jgi:hypothetical protein
MTIKRILLCSIVALVSACGGSSGSSGSCTFTLNQQMECYEYSGLTADQITAEKNACTAQGANASWASSGCSHTNALGGCSATSAGISATTWYYTGGGQTSDMIKSACTQGGGTFVSP